MPLIDANFVGGESAKFIFFYDFLFDVVCDKCRRAAIHQWQSHQ
jgi:hypothetical protein